MKVSPLFKRKDQTEQQAAGFPGGNLFRRFSRWSGASLSFSVALFLAGTTVTVSLFLLLAFWQGPVQKRDEIKRSNTPLGRQTGRQQISKSWGTMPLSFEANHGQTDSEVRFLARGRGYGLFLTGNEAVFSFQPAADSQPSPKDRLRRPMAGKSAGKSPVVLKMQMVGARPAPAVAGQEPLASRSHYFIGNDPKDWHTDVPQFAKVRYEGVYPGIDVVYYGNQRQLEYDFVLAPGADPGQIGLRFDGARKLAIAESGELVLTTEAGEIRQPKPVVYQPIAGVKQPVEGRYVRHAGGQVGFEIAEYDRTQPLVIDPVLIYSTFLGGSDIDYVNAIQADSAGIVYVTGVTYSFDFPTKNPLQFNQRGFGNAFVAKYNSDGSLAFSTYLGGESEDVGASVTSDSSGNVYLVGATDSTTFPTTLSAKQKQNNGGLDLFVVKLNTTGAALMASSYYGGQGDESANGVAIDSSGNVYATGITTSIDFPTVAGFQSENKGGTDAFVTKFNADSSLILYSTTLGGTGREIAFSIAVDGTGAAAVTGFTSSPDFPTKNPAQASLAGNDRVDGFVTKLVPAGNALVYSTYFGGSDDDGGYGIAFDGASNAYVSGFSTSTNFPTKNPIQSNNAGFDDAVVLKLDTAGALVYATYLGGSGDEQGYDILAESTGEVIVGGGTDSNNFPVKNAIQSSLNTGITTAVASVKKTDPKTLPISRNEDGIASRYGRKGSWLRDFSPERAARSAQTSAVIRDGFITKLSASGGLVSSTYLGGADEDEVYGVASNHAGHLFAAGITASGNFPVKTPAQVSLRGVADGFVTRIADSAITQTSVSAASFAVGPVAPEQIVAIFGSGLAPSTGAATSIPLPTTLGGISVKIVSSTDVERFAPLFYASPTQINYAIPTGIELGTATVCVLTNGVITSTETLEIGLVSPGIFAANANGRDVVAGVLLRVKADGSQQYEPIVSYDAILQKFVPAPIVLAGAGEQVFLVLFATGVRNRSSLGNTAALVGGASFLPVYAGPQGTLVGLDQINLLLPSSLAGRGEVDLSVTVDGKASNTVRVNFQ